MKSIVKFIIQSVRLMKNALVLLLNMNDLLAGLKKLYSCECKTPCYVPLKPLQFDDIQPGNPKIKFDEERLTATRIGEDYRDTMLDLRNTLKLNEFIVIQILKISSQHVGSIKLFLKREGNDQMLLYADSKCKPNDILIVWMNKKGELFYKRDDKISFLESIEKSEVDNYKLICDMYGQVKQIRAYVGLKDYTHYHPSRYRYGYSANSGNADTGSGSSSAPVSQTEDSAAGNDPYLKLHIRGKYEVEQIRVHNLPGVANTILPNNADGSQTDVCSGTDGSRKQAVEECNICMDENANTIIIPCGHSAFCYQCASRVAIRCGMVCPICRTEIKNWQKVYSKVAQCNACEKNQANTVLIPCGDMCVCDLCSINVRTCPSCGMLVRNSQKII